MTNPQRELYYNHQPITEKELKMEEKILTSDLPNKTKLMAEELLSRRGQIKRIEEQVSKEKNECNDQLLKLIDMLGYKTVYGPDSSATMTQKITRVLNEKELVAKVLNFISPFVSDVDMKKIEGTLTPKIMKALIEDSKDEKLSKPFINFTFNTKE